MKKLVPVIIYLYVIVLGGHLNVNAQSIGDEWINFSKTYFKITLAEDGMYKIAYDDLSEAGFPVTSINPRRLQIYHRGVEQAIYVAGQNDASFDNSDYILFYGQKNDGTLDSALYLDTDAQPHKYYNLYSDTSVYYLTYSIDGSNGKRMESFKENNVFGLSAESAHDLINLDLRTGSYSIGYHYPLGQTSAKIYRSEFDYGEGWTGTSIGNGNQQTFTYSAFANAYRSGDAPEIEILLAGRNNLSHNATIYVGPSTSNLRLIHTAEFNYYSNYTINESLQWSDISSAGTVVVQMRVNGVNSSTDYVSVSYIKLTVPETLNQQSASSKTYHLLPNANDKSYIEITNVPTGRRLFDITDVDQIIEIGMNASGTTINAIIPETSSAKTLFMTSDFKDDFIIQPVKFRNLSLTNKSYIIISHPSLRVATDSYSDPVKAYAAFRASSAGGGYDTLTVNIGDLYNLYSYGETTPLAIFNFCRDLVNSASPEYLFIIGKGLTPNYNAHREDFNTQTYHDLIPTSGYPGSDYLFSSGLGDTQYEPSIATGRLSANSADDIEAYLNKVKEMASLPYDDLWRKHLIHLSGGRGSTEQNLFQYYIESFEDVAEGPYLGGTVESKSKKTNNSTELINISELINDGVGLVTFFGHSSSSSTDIEIGLVSDENQGYDNQGKYTTLLVNGCNAGDMYFTGSGWGEDWVITPEKGAIAFIAHTGVGISTTLRSYTTEFYLKGFADKDLIEKGIGDIHKAAVESYASKYGTSSLDIAQMQQMALNGDPAVHLFGASLPDFAITSEDIFVQSNDGETVNVFSESFDLGLITKNYGRTSDDSLKVVVTRKLSNGSTSTLDTLSTVSVYNEDTLYITVPSLGLDSYGNNEFTISLDPLNAIDELNETNNTATFTYFLPLGGTSNVYPRHLSVINESDPTLIVQSLDLFTGDRTFLIEIDTTEDFNSTQIQSTSISGNVLAKWDVDLFANMAEKDTTIFFVRSKYANPKEGELDEWTMTSFTYISTVEDGWNMSQFDQFQWIDSDEIERDEATQSWEFKSFSTPIEVITFGANHPDLGQEDVKLYIDGESYIYANALCTDNSINLVAFDRGTTAPYLNLSFSAIDVLNRKHCGERPMVINNFINSEIESESCSGEKCIDYYMSQVPEGDFVLLFSIGNVTYQNWSTSTIDSLATIGISQSDILSLVNGDPIIALGRKGDAPGTATVIKAETTPSDEQEITYSDVLEGNIRSGTIFSPKIGPAASWQTAAFKASKTPAGGDETTTFRIYGIDEDQNSSLISEYSSNGEVNLEGISTDQYPYLQLAMYTSDEDNFTPSQLKSWRIWYEGVPEGVLYYAEDQEESNIEKQEGETVSANFYFENISKYDFSDSVSVQYDVYNQSSRNEISYTQKIGAVKSDTLEAFTIEFPTNDITGLNDLNVFANPRVLAEQSYNNNVNNFEDYIDVSADETNPILEVTVDGRFILDGDIVSPTPQISIRLKDENSVIVKDDTTGVDIYLGQVCDDCTQKRISFSSSEVSWTPASEEDDFEVLYNPSSLEDGQYLLTVQAEDESGNQAGEEAYSVTFEVINESQITNFFPYPNPFSSSTRFVFTLTGTQIPDDIIIQIMTISGKVVREITMDELGTIHIGNNQTEYAWDGKDEYGDQLANGVYLYRVKIQMNGETLKKRSTSADKAFKNGIGKLYLLR